MAHEAWIEAATRQQKPTVPSDIERSGQHLLYQPSGTAEEEARERDRATKFVRRLGGEHADELLQALGLDETDDE
jgi:hypothetical protein